MKSNSFKVRLLHSSFLSLLSLAVSAKVMAMEMNITHGNLISHTESASGQNARGSIKDVANNQFNNQLSTIKNALQRNNVTGETIVAIPTILKASGSIGSPIAISGSSAFYIENHTASTHTYDIETTICVERETINVDDCFNIKDQITLDPEGSASYKQAPMYTLYEMFDSAGSQNTAILTMVRSDSGNTTYTTSAFSSVEVK